MSKKITYEDKIAIYNDPDVPEESKVIDENMNELKEVINNNADELDTTKEIAEQAKEIAEGIKPYDDTEIRQEISSLKEEDKRLAETIPKNTSDLNNDSKFQTEEEVTESIGQAKEELQGKIDECVKTTEFQESQETQDTEITKLQEENEMLKGLLPTVTGKGEDVTLKGTGEMPFKKFEVSGNAIQDGEPSPDNKVEIKTIGNNITITKTNKNLINFSDKEKNGIKYYDKNKIKIVNLTGNLSQTECFSNINPLVKGKKITFTFLVNGTGSKDELKLIVASKNKDYLVDQYISFNNANYNNKKLIHTVVLSEDDELKRLMVFVATDRHSPICDLDIEVQLEIGDTSTDIITPELEIKTLPVQQPMLKGDYFDLERGKEVHIMKLVTYDGSTDESVMSSNRSPSGNSTGYVIITPTVLNTKLICDKFKVYPINEINSKDIEGIALRGGANGFYFVLSNSRTENYENIKKYLEENPITIAYQNPTPIELNLTEDQKTALQQLSELKTYEGTTHIFSEDEVSPIFDVEAYAKIVNANNQVQSEPSSEPPTYEAPSMEDNQMDEPSFEDTEDEEVVE